MVGCGERRNRWHQPRAQGSTGNKTLQLNENEARGSLSLTTAQNRAGGDWRRQKWVRGKPHIYFSMYKNTSVQIPQQSGRLQGTTSDLIVPPTMLEIGTFCCSQVWMPGSQPESYQQFSWLCLFHGNVAQQQSVCLEWARRVLSSRPAWNI